MSNRKLSIVVADDVDVNLRILSLLLNRLGHEPEMATTGLEVLSILKRQYCELLLIDLQMPELDGLSTIRQIRKLGENIQQPWIVAMTGLAEWRETVLQSGADEFLLKPIRLDELKSVLSGIGNQTSSSALFDGLVSPTRSEGVLDPTIIDSLRALDDDGFIKDLVATASRDLPDQVADLEASLRAHTRDATLVAAHRLRGVAATLGGVQLADLARQVEEQVKGSGSFQGLTELIPNLKASLALTLRELQRLAA